MTDAVLERMAQASLRKPLTPKGLTDAERTAILGPEWGNLEWRLDNLYTIVDEESNAIAFVLNDEQREFIHNIRPRNLILKARQLGFSTLLQVLILDQSLFNDNHSAMVIADTLPNATKLFGKADFAYKRLQPAMQAAFPLATASKTEMEFGHANGNSKYSVGVSARGGTFQILHISEMGKIAVKYPARSAEIITGAFEAVPASGLIVVESTAEGNAGDFFDLCDAALKRKQAGLPESDLDFRIHFFPWYRKKAYRLDPIGVAIPQALHQYFNGLEASLGIKFDPEQRAWYAKKAEVLARKMKREHPSTPKEAFEVATEGAVYGMEMEQIRSKGRICHVPLDVTEKVNTFWDLGTSGYTAIWYHQHIQLQNRFFRYRYDNHRGLGWWWATLEEDRKAGGWMWGKHYLPHDAAAEVLGESVDTKERILARCGMERIEIVPRVADLDTGIEVTRRAMVKDVFIDPEGCVDGIKALDGYTYVWDDDKGQWTKEPHGNWASHGADAFRQWAQGFEPNPRRDGDDERKRHRRTQRNWKTS